MTVDRAVGWRPPLRRPVRVEQLRRSCSSNCRALETKFVVRNVYTYRSRAAHVNEGHEGQLAMTRRLAVVALGSVLTGFVGTVVARCLTALGHQEIRLNTTPGFA